MYDESYDDEDNYNLAKLKDIKARNHHFNA